MSRLVALALGSLALVLAVPVAAQELAPGEMALHIEALGQVPPDTARVPINLVGTGKDQKAADADLAKMQAELYAKLAKLGIPQDKIEIMKDADPGYPEVTAVEAAIPYSGCVDAAASRMLADEPAAEPVDRTVPIRAVVTDCPEPQVSATRMVLVTVEDLKKLEAVYELVGEDNYFRATRLRIYTRDPAAAKVRAVSLALSNARADADTYAATLGMKVLRIVRVSNAKSAINWPDIAMLIGGFERQIGGFGPGMGGSEYEQFLAIIGGTYAGAQVDYVLGPK